MLRPNEIPVLRMPLDIRPYEGAGWHDAQTVLPGVIKSSLHQRCADAVPSFLRSNLRVKQVYCSTALPESKEGRRSGRARFHLEATCGCVQRDFGFAMCFRHSHTPRPGTTCRASPHFASTRRGSGRGPGPRAHAHLITEEAALWGDRGNTARRHSRRQARGRSAETRSGQRKCWQSRAR